MHSSLIWGMALAASLCSAAAAAQEAAPIGDGTRYVCVYSANTTALGKIVNGSTVPVPFAAGVRAARGKISYYRLRLMRAEQHGNVGRIEQYRRQYNAWLTMLNGIRACRRYYRTIPTPTPVPTATPSSQAACIVFSSSLRSGAFPRIINGSACNEPSAVVEVVLLDWFGSALGMCSGTVIAPRVVLTAAHCFSLRELGHAVASVRVVAGGQRYETRNFFVDSRFSPYADYVEVNDLAVVLLSADLTVPTMPILSSPAFAPGEQAAIAGYGKTETGTLETLRAGFMSLSSYTTESLVAVYRRTGSNTCEGDSGGPLAVKRNGSWYLAGVTSNGSDQNCGIYGQSDTSRFTNVTSAGNRAFIAQFVASD